MLWVITTTYNQNRVSNSKISWRCRSAPWQAQQKAALVTSPDSTDGGTGHILHAMSTRLEFTGTDLIVSWYIVMWTKKWKGQTNSTNHSFRSLLRRRDVTNHCITQTDITLTKSTEDSCNHKYCEVVRHCPYGIWSGYSYLRQTTKQRTK
jgi:hypothetical protein